MPHTHMHAFSSSSASWVQAESALTQLSIDQRLGCICMMYQHCCLGLMFVCLLLLLLLQVW